MCVRYRLGQRTVCNTYEFCVDLKFVLGRLSVHRDQGGNFNSTMCAAVGGPAYKGLLPYGTSELLWFSWLEYYTIVSEFTFFRHEWFTLLCEFLCQ